MLFYTGITRTAENVAKSYVEGIQAKKKQLIRMYAMVDEAIDILMDGNLDDFGLLLNETWQEKRSLSKMVSNSQVDEIYASAIDAGALGGKLSGAGGGGFFTFYCEEKQSQLRHEMKKQCLIELRYDFDFEGTKVLANFMNYQTNGNGFS